MLELYILFMLAFSAYAVGAPLNLLTTLSINVTMIIIRGHLSGVKYARKI